MLPDRALLRRNRLLTRQDLSVSFRADKVGAFRIERYRGKDAPPSRHHGGGLVQKRIRQGAGGRDRDSLDGGVVRRTGNRSFTGDGKQAWPRYSPLSVSSTRLTRDSAGRFKRLLAGDAGDAERLSRLSGRRCRPVTGAARHGTGGF